MASSAGKRALRALRPVISWSTRREVLPWRVYDVLPYSFCLGETEVPVGNGLSFRYRVEPDEVVGLYLFKGGLRHWERESLAVFSHLARRARRVLDVGAIRRLHPARVRLQP